MDEVEVGQVVTRARRELSCWRLVRLLVLGSAFVGGALLLAACDPPPPHTFTVTSTLDKIDVAPGDGVCQTATPGECTLRAAIQEANALAGDDTIELQGTTTYPLTISGTGEEAAAKGDLDLASNITLHGHGSVIDARHLDHVVQVRSGTVKVDHLTLQNANGSGLDAVAGATTVSDSTFAANTVGVSSGGSASVSLTRSTVAGSTGWGISIAGGQVLLLDTTIGANGSGGISTAAGTASATNTIVGEQTAGPGCSSAITSGGWNLDPGATCGFTQSTDLQSTPAGLGPLAVNGGSIPTMRPMVGSAAVDSGQPGCTGTDERGKPRPVDGNGDGTAACDRGAVETDAWHPLSLTVDSTADLVDDAPGDGVCHAADGTCTLRAAIQESNGSTGPDVVTLAANTTYALDIYGPNEDGARSGDLDIASPLTLHGSGSTISGSSDNVLDVHTQGVGLDHLAITIGNTAGLFVRPRATLTVDDSTIWRNNASGVSAGQGSTVVLRRSTVSDTVHDGVVSSGATITLLDATVADNERNLVVTAGSVMATNSVVADPTTGPNCTGTIASGGWNLSTDASCGFGGATDVTDGVGHLGPLVRFGASTVPSRVPTTGSAGIDTGRPDCTGTDERGQGRPTDGDGDTITGCDRGAVEAPTWHPMAFVVDSQTDWPDANPGDGLCVATNGGSCTLRAAIQESSAATGPDTIDLGTGLTYNIYGTTPEDDVGVTGDLDVVGDLILHGHGSTLHPVSLVALQEFGSKLTIDHLSADNSETFIDNRYGSVSLADVTLNATTSISSTGGGALTVTRGNLLAKNGPAIQQKGSGPVVLDASTVAGVSASGGNITISSSTISIGVAVQGGAATITNSTIVGGRVGIALLSGGTASATNSIIEHTLTPGSDCEGGGIISGGWNLASDHSCSLSAPSDLQDTDPLLSPIRDHGGPTRTSTPLTGSAAIDSGRPGCAATDQSGLIRPTDGNGDGISGCDRGAVELGTWRSLTLPVTSSNDSHDVAPGDGLCQAADGSGCTLRAAIEEAGSSAGPDVVNVAVPWLSLVLPDPDLGDGSTGSLSIDTDVAIHGGGSALNDGTLRLLASTIAIDHLSLPYTTNEGAHLTISDSALRAPVTLTAYTSAPTSLQRVTASGIVSTGVGSVTIDSSALGLGLQATGSGTVTISRSTLGGSDADRGLIIGGGATAAISSSTITGRVRAIDGSYLNAPLTALTALSLTDSTVVGGTDGAVRWLGGTVTATNTIVSATAGGAACAPQGGSQMTSGGWNLVTDSSCGLGAATDLQGSDPKLRPLADYGGTAPTFVPGSGSPAVDSGRPGCTGTDERGGSRTQDGDGDGSAVCDRGAVELETYRSLTLAVDATTTEPDAAPGDGVCRTAAPAHCTLIAAVQEANRSNGPDTVTLAADTTYTMAPSTSIDVSVEVSDQLTLQGSGSTAQGLALHAGNTTLDVVGLRFESGGITADGSTVTIDRTTIASHAPIEVRAGSHATVTHSSVFSPVGSPPSGAGITARSSDLVIDDSTIADLGTGVYDFDSTATITNTTISVVAEAIDVTFGSSATVANTVVARPVGNTTAVGCNGPVDAVSLGWNLTFDSTCGFRQPTDLQSTDAKLGPLGTFGGTTPSRVPSPGSPAIDSGRPTCSATDQRGRLRPADGNADGTAACDRGAIEVQPAHSLDLVVTDTADRIDADPGDGVCATSTPVVCTLRAAVEESAATPGSDTITLATKVSYLLTRSGTGEDASASGDLDVVGSLTLHGNGSTLNAGGFESAVQIFSGSTSIDHLTITGVSTSPGSAAIDSQADDLTFSDGTVNSAGLGIVDRGSGWMKVYRSTVGGTTSVANRSTNSVTVTDSTLTAGGFTTGTGFESSSTGPSALIRTTINNRAVAVSTGSGALTVQTSTITGNLYGLGTGTGTATVIDSTLVNNPYGSLLPTVGKIAVSNSIISSGGPQLCRAGTGTIVSLGWNLTSDTSCGFTQTGDVQGVPTQLGLLANNGGSTFSFLPAATSPAVGTGKPGCTGKDQRGVVRPSGGACDKGSVER